MPRVFDLHLDKATYVHKRGDEKNEDKTRPLTPGVPEVLAFAEFKPQPVALPATAREPVLLPYVLEDHLAAAEKEIALAKTALATAQAKLDDLLRDEIESAQVLEQAQAAVAVTEKAIVAAEAKPAMLRAACAAERLRSTEPNSPAHATAAAAAAKADAVYQLARAETDLAKARLDAFTPADRESAGPAKEDPGRRASRGRGAQESWRRRATNTRRSALRSKRRKGRRTRRTRTSKRTPKRAPAAGWRSRNGSPMSAIPSPPACSSITSGCAISAPRSCRMSPTSAAAVRRRSTRTCSTRWPPDFMQHGWSMKYLHRAMVLSQLYRRSSSNAGATEETLAADPDNACYWRMNPRRLESQAVRDAMLQAAGLLDLHVGGPEPESR